MRLLNFTMTILITFKTKGKTMEIKTQGEINTETCKLFEKYLGRDGKVNPEYTKKVNKKKWVALDGLAHNIKMMRELWSEDNLNEDDFDNLIKELS